MKTTQRSRTLEFADSATSERLEDIYGLVTSPNPGFHDSQVLGRKTHMFSILATLNNTANFAR